MELLCGCRTKHSTSAFPLTAPHPGKAPRQLGYGHCFSSVIRDETSDQAGPLQVGVEVCSERGEGSSECDSSLSALFPGA